MTIKVILALAIITAVQCLASAQAEEAAAVARVENGREFRGTIDTASNASQLILRTNTPGITLKRGIRWERLLSLSVNGPPRDIATLRAEFNKVPLVLKRPPLLRKVEVRSWPVVPAIANADD